MTSSEPMLAPDLALAVEANLGRTKGEGGIPAYPFPVILGVIRLGMLPPLAGSCLLLLIERGSITVLLPTVEGPELGALAVLEPVLLLALSVVCRLLLRPWRLARKALFISFKRSSTADAVVSIGSGTDIVLWRLGGHDTSGVLPPAFDIWSGTLGPPKGFRESISSTNADISSSSVFVLRNEAP